MSPTERRIDCILTPDISRSSSRDVKSAGRKDSRSRSYRSAGYDSLERVPRQDEFRRSSASLTGENRRRSETSRTKDGARSLERSSSHEGRRTESNRTKRKRATSTRPDYEHMTYRERSARRAKRARQRKLRALKRKCFAIGTPIVAGAAAVLIATGAFSNKDNKIDSNNTIVAIADESKYDALASAASNNEDITIAYDEDSNTIYVDERECLKAPSEDDKETGIIEESAPPHESAKEARIEEVKNILNENPDIKKAFNDVEITLRRASIEYGGNVVDLLDEMNEKFGLDNLPLELQICVMEHETTGYFTDWETGDVIVKQDGDTGWYQLTDVAEDDVDRIARWLTKRGVAKEDINEIIDEDGYRRTMRGNAGHGAMVLSYLNTIYDGDIEKILSAYNAGEGFANNGGKIEDYIQGCYKEHLEPLSRYDVLWDYIMDRDYYEFEDDGVPHVYVNPEDGSVRYPEE